MAGMLPLAAVYGLFGLVIGSFLNVCIHRIPRGESVVRPASRCPSCGKPVRPYDNIPVLAYLWLRGKCRFCRGRIPLRYPAVELLTALAFYLCGRTWGAAPAGLLNAAFLSILIVLVFIDYDHQILPDVLTIPGAILGLAASPLQAEAFFRDPIALAVATRLAQGNAAALLPWIGSLIGALAGGGLLFLVAWIYETIRHRQGLGMGDVKMMALVGSFLGWRLALLTIFAGSLAGSLVGLLLVALRGQTLETRLAFGTFLGFGAAAALFLGLPFLSWYLGNIR